MYPRRNALARRAISIAAVAAAALALAVVMTWPLARGMSTLGRSTRGGDGLFSVWNVAWVAHALVSNPSELYDANIFYPHRLTLAFSEANIGAGVVAVPAWLITGNAYATHNSAVLFAFASALVAMWLLARYISGDSAAAAVAASLFAFCPYLMTHTTHIQLLMCAGLPLVMLLTHRLADRPSMRRALLLGLALAAQGLSCAYYGIFAGLMVGYTVLFFAVTRSIWRNAAYWRAVVVAAVTAVVPVIPFFLPHLIIQREQGFRRTIGDAVRYSANAQSYVASPAHAHRWLLDATAAWPPWIDALFPGFLALGLGLAGLVLFSRRSRHPLPRRPRETAFLYGSLGVLAFWASFGPSAGLYSVLFRLPLFSFLRAPSRLGLIVTLALAVLSAMTLQRLLARVHLRAKPLVAVGIGIVAMVELNVLPFPWERARQIPAAYAQLRALPRRPLAEFPYYGTRPVFHLHTQYMLFSTAHWQPMINGYSDHIPQDFRDSAGALATFPSRQAFDALRQDRVRYIGVHWDMFAGRADSVREQLIPYQPYLRRIASDETMTLYEIMGFP